MRSKAWAMAAGSILTKTDMPASARQRRKRSPERIEQIIRIAERYIVESGSLPLPLNAISDEMGTSRALVYAYFSDPDQLAETVLLRHFNTLSDNGLVEAASSGSIYLRAQKSATIYLEHVAQHDNVIHNILREVPRGVQLTAPATGFRNSLLRQLANSARRELSLTIKEAITLVELLVAMPEELGRMVRRSELKLDDAQAICGRLMQAGLESFQPDRESK